VYVTARNRNIIQHFRFELVVIFISVLLIGFTACSDGNQAKSKAAAPGPPPTVPKPVSAVVKLLSGPHENGQHVDLNDAAVEEVSKTQNLIWVGPGGDQQIIVVYGKNAIPLSRSGKEQKLYRGSVVTISGTVKKAPDALQAQREWHLNKDQAALLEKIGFYVDATSIVPQGV